MNDPELFIHLKKAVAYRQSFYSGDHDQGFRLFNGHYEGCRGLVMDVYATTLVIFTSGEFDQDMVRGIYLHVIKQLPWVDCVIHKHHGDEPDPGKIVYGNNPATQITEHSITYALDLLMNQDASFYLDTRNLRDWLLENSQNKQVLNTFAYTGSLGVAALAGGAKHVIQTDLNKSFLAIAHQSGILNRLDISRMKLFPADFFSLVSRYKRSGKLFDIVILDPPFFSTTDKGTIDLATDTVRLINKVRPLVQHKGFLVVVNNALYLPGNQFHSALLNLSADKYLNFETIVPVPLDVTGYPQTIVSHPPVDPSPYNHSTKIAILSVLRKQSSV